ncbi:MAG: hypothetical protein K5669_12510 [Lachnospiraceae bacterium]|nr:hypothetical protein [Lachnospiraceae bacterium]
MSKTQKRSSIGFWVFYIIFILVLVGFWIYFLNGVIKKDLAIYEAAQPGHVMEELVSKIQEGDLSSMNFVESSSRFESPDVYKDAFTAAIAGKTVTFKENETSYDSNAPVYELYADDAHIATVNIKSVSSEQLMFILSVQEWEIASVTPLYEAGSNEVVIEVPDSYTVSVNGVAVDERELVGEPTDYMEFEIAAQYVEVPKKLTYSISGLVSAPSVEVKDAAGNVVACEQDGNTYTAGFAGGEVPADIADSAVTNAKNISDIYAGDRTLSSMKSLFPEDSYLIPLFQNYINHDLWMYSGHTTPSFSEEATSNYIRYNDSFYSVEVSFVKTMYLPKRSMTVHDKTHNTYYYANINGNWLIVDMISMNEE